MTTTGSTVVLVDVENDDGSTIFQASVYIDYAKSTESDYGADADGNRGLALVEFSILDKFMDADTLKRMRSDQVERALESAESLFLDSPYRYAR